MLSSVKKKLEVVLKIIEIIQSGFLKQLHKVTYKLFSIGVPVTNNAVGSRLSKFLKHVKNIIETFLFKKNKKLLSGKSK